MKRKPIKDHLTAEFVRSVLEYDPETGEFRWKYRPDRPRKWNTRYAGTIAGYISDGYRLIQLEADKGGYRAARVAWIIMKGEWPSRQVDHIDTVGSNDRWRNLRLATNGENGFNKSAQANNRSGYKGVSRWGKGDLWQARINVAGKVFKLGIFDTPEAAAAAYREAAQRLHGEFARTL